MGVARLMRASSENGSKSAKPHMSVPRQRLLVDICGGNYVSNLRSKCRRGGDRDFKAQKRAEDGEPARRAAHRWKERDEAHPAVALGSRSGPMFAGSAEETGNCCIFGPLSGNCAKTSNRKSAILRYVVLRCWSFDFMQ